MRILFLNQAPRKSTHYDPAAIEAQLNSYASHGTKVEIGFPDDYEGAQLFEFDRRAGASQRPAPHDGDARAGAEDLLGRAERL